MPERMTWPEACEAARSGLHVRREAWAPSCWLIYQRGVAWFWNGAEGGWRVVDAPDFGKAEWEAEDWTTIPRALKDCCRTFAFTACEGNVSHWTGLGNPYGVATLARIIHTEANAVIEWRMDEPGMGLYDGVWVPLNPRVAGAFAPLDYTFALPADGHFSIRTIIGEHRAGVPISITVCFGGQTPVDEMPEIPAWNDGDDTPPEPPPLPPPIPPRPRPKPICADYSYPSRSASPVGEIFGEITISNPYPARARVTITGGVDDELVVNGSRAEGGSRSAHGDVNYSLELGAGESCTIGGADNYGGNVWYNYRVCVERL